MASKTLSIWQQLTLGFLLVLAVISFAIIWIFDLSVQPHQDARARAEKVAKSYSDLDKIDNFAIFSKEKTYYSLQGRSADNDQLAVLVPESGGDVLIYNLNHGLTADEAAAVAKENGAGSAKKVTMGAIDEKAVWEVYADRAYYYIDFESGDFISKEGL